MSGPFTLRITRPYASREDYLEGDYWTVERSEMLLLGVEGVAEGASVTFEIVLENKEIVVRGEGRALEIVPPRNGRPGGVRVRFKQLDVGSKATLRRALEIQRKLATAAAAAATATEAVPAATETAPVATETAPVAEGATAAASMPIAEPEREEPSGVHHIVKGPIRTPENRDALLQRLRERGQLRKGADPVEKSTAAAE